MTSINKRLIALGAVACVALAGCQTHPTEVSPSTNCDGAIASFEGNRLSLRELETTMRARSPSRPALDELAASYRQAALRLLVENTLLDGIEDPIALLSENQQFRRLRDQLALEAFWNTPANTVPEPLDAAVRSFYETNPEAFRKKPRALLAMIFRRTSESEPEPAPFLERLALRVSAGEAFEALAREYSHSETQALGGELGWIEGGALAPEVERVVFALDEGDVSGPIPVGGGYAIFRASAVQKSIQATLEEARTAIISALVQEQRLAHLESQVRKFSMPAGSLILNESQLESALAGGSPAQVLLRLATVEIDQLKLQERSVALARESPLRAALGNATWDAYRQLKAEWLLLANRGPQLIADSGRLSERLEESARQMIVEEKIQQEFDRRVDLDALKSFWEDNHFSYQTNLKTQIRWLRLPLDQHARQRVVEMEALRSAIGSGSTTPESAARALGAQLSDVEWIEFGGGSELSSKVRAYIADVGDSGWTAPFQIEPHLAMIEVVERQAPRPLDFEEARAAVVSDYKSRHGQQLYGELEAEIVSDHQFCFDETALFQALGVDPQLANQAPALD